MLVQLPTSVAVIKLVGVVVLECFLFHKPVWVIRVLSRVKYISFKTVSIMYDKADLRTRIGFQQNHEILHGKIITTNSP